MFWEELFENIANAGKKKNESSESTKSKRKHHLFPSNKKEKGHSVMVFIDSQSNHKSDGLQISSCPLSPMSMRTKHSIQEQATPLRSNRTIPNGFRKKNDDVIPMSIEIGTISETSRHDNSADHSPDITLPDLRRVTEREKTNMLPSVRKRLQFESDSHTDQTSIDLANIQDSSRTRSDSRDSSIGIGMGVDIEDSLLRNGYSYDERSNASKRDDESIGTHHTAEHYEQLQLTVGKKNGLIYLEAEIDNKDTIDKKKDLDFQNEDSSIDTIDENKLKQPSMDESSSGESDEAREDKEKYKLDESQHSFQLAPTNIQSQRDHKQHLFHQTRKACLEAAAAAYKDAHLDVPDIILAQINDHRQHLSGHHLFFGAKKESKVTESSLSDEETKNEIAAANDSHKKIIKLCKDDEIHVAPCQCALRLIGLRERKVSFDANEAKGDSSRSDSGQNYTSKVNEATSDKFRHTRTISTIYPSVDDDEDDDNVSLNSTRSARRRNDRDELKQNVDTKSNTGSKGHQRSDSNLFQSLEYHEITLIRNHQTLQTISEDNAEKYVEWDAITIRCSSHDQLDALVKALRVSSKAKVVPFSSNPKERLKQLRRERSMRAQVIQEESDTISVAHSENSVIEGSHDTISPMSPKTVNVSCDESKATSIASEDNSVVKETEEKRLPWDFKFNKKEYCELCDLTFTLLTRRHHCRQCERSCCGHCSRLLIEKGCDEKRYCNRCASSILEKQAKALRGKLRKKNKDALPGKVHEACKELGVNVIGRLPHWRTFLRPQLENRPAVGRLTVEILEAIALPSVDLVNGKVDPYVRATITGYDRDLKWTLRQWLQKNRYSLCSRFCSATLCPQWRGTGRKGGELLTLPVICTAGAVLRLEVLHYNVLHKNREKDQVLGIVEIPLSDLPNANLRRPDGIEIITEDGKRKTLSFDGYCDRWYRLIPSDELDGNTIVLSKPILSPEFNSNRKDHRRKVGMQSLEEVGKRIQAGFFAPVEWIASAIKLDLPARRPEAICQQHKSRSMIHIRIKLNTSVFGDFISHAWFPPVRKDPIPPQFDPEILLTRILTVGKLTEPYRKLIQYIEFCIKWKHPPKTCIRAYVIFALHLAIFTQFLPLLHIYLFIFLGVRLKEMLGAKEKREDILSYGESFDDDGKQHMDASTSNLIRKDSDDSFNIGETNHSISDVGNDEGFESLSRKDSMKLPSSPSLQALKRSSNLSPQKNPIPVSSVKKPSKMEQSSSNTSLTNSKGSQDTEEEGTKLNAAIHWIAKRLGEDKGLEILQFKLGLLCRDLRNINSVWNGKNPLLTKTAMICLVLSFILHFLVNRRILWILGTASWYFAQSPFVKITIRFIFGLHRGAAKMLRRQQLLDSEILAKID